MPLGDLALAGGLFMSAVMVALWIVERRTRNASTVDVAWSFGTGALAVWFALAGTGGLLERQLLVAVLMGAWGLRLGMHILARVRVEPEDGRYQRMRAAMGRHDGIGFLAFFIVQAWWAVLFALPAWAAARSSTPLGWADAAGVAVFLTALIGEGAADGQLARFRAEPSNAGKVCRDGLWRYSRHPNYFFEWTHWLAYVLIGIASPVWWVCAGGVVVMYVFLTRITGIPHTETQSLARRGEAYREYQRTTSAFFPLPPRRGATNADGLGPVQENGP